MLKLTTRGRYGIRAMLELAWAHESGQHLTLAEIARRQEISRKYVDNIFSSLRGAGLLISFRGAQGGFALAKSPEEIPVRVILEALEGPIAVVECVTSTAYCTRWADCVARSLWIELTEALRRALDGLTLASLAARAGSVGDGNLRLASGDACALEGLAIPESRGERDSAGSQEAESRSAEDPPKDL